MSTALQTPANAIDASSVSLNHAEPSLTGAKFARNKTVQPSPKAGLPWAHHAGTIYCKVTYKSEFFSQETQFAEAHCWHSLFRHSAIVLGYPIPSRPHQRPGLELPFSMVAALACAERITSFCDNLMVKGFSTLLYLTGQEDKYMFWHLVHNEDGSRISFADDRVVLPAQTKSSVLQIKPDDVNETRHIVG